MFDDTGHMGGDGRIQHWQLDEIASRVFYKMMNHTGWVTLSLPDDTQPTQTHQIEGYTDEVRPTVRRSSEFGYSALPLPGSKAFVLYQGGQRSLGVIIGTEDPRYRPTGLLPGEAHFYMVTGADKSGAGGTLRSVIKAVGDWVCTLFGKTINIGDTNAQTISIGTTASGITINMGNSGATVNITGGDGDVVIDGISLRHHKHIDPQGGEVSEPVP